MAVSTKTTHRFREIVESRHSYAREWQARTGQQVIGYLCTYVPEEVIYAAGMLPVRILGSHEPEDVTEPHIPNTFCAFSRDCLAQGLQGKYDYLGGIVNAHSCIQIRQTFDCWLRHVPIPFNHYVFMPVHIQSEQAKALFAQEVATFKDSLQAWTGTAITMEALDRSIDIYNTNRRLLRQIYEMRKADNPTLSGAETMDMVLASMLMDKMEHNRLLEAAIQEFQSQETSPSPGPRLMLVGSENDDIELLRLIESLGAIIVVDENCMGSRYFWNEVLVPSHGEGFPGRLSAIASRYVSKPPCPLKDMPQRWRLPHIAGLARDYRVAAAILVRQKFCDVHEYDMPSIQAMLGDLGIPSLGLETDITTPVGQFRTRIEAFLEMLPSSVQY